MGRVTSPHFFNVIFLREFFMVVDPEYITNFFPGDRSIIEQFSLNHNNTTFENYAHMLDCYEKFVEDLNLTYIEDEMS